MRDVATLLDPSLIAKLRGGGVYFIASVSYFATGLVVMLPSSSESSSVLISILRFIPAFFLFWSCLATRLAGSTFSGPTTLSLITWLVDF